MTWLHASDPMSAQHNARAALLLACLLSFACGAPTAAPAPSHVPAASPQPTRVHYGAVPNEQPREHKITYAYAWDQQGVEFPSSGGWTTTTDLGYRIHVQQGSLTNYSMQLVPCAPPTSQARMQRATAPTWWQHLQLVTPAMAGHGHVPLDASLLSAHIEDISKLQDSTAGSRWSRNIIYCQAHYLIAYASTSPTPQPATDSSAYALRIHGSYQHDAQQPAQPFKVESTLALGKLLDLQLARHATERTVPISFNSNYWGADITLLRHPQRMFDGVDFSALTQTQLNYAVLQALLRSTQVYAQPQH